MIVRPNDAETDRHLQVGPLEWTVVWIIILFGGNANSMARSLGSWELTAAPALFLGIHLTLAIKKRISADWRILGVLLGFGAYFVATTVKYGEMHPRFAGAYFIYFICVFIALRALGDSLFYCFEKVIYWLSCIGLVFWVLQIVASGAVRSILTALAPFRSVVTEGGVNAVFYTMQFQTFSIPRNCGFAWEPGGFASILVFAIFLNLTRTNMGWKNNLELKVFLAALVSTQSTTGWATAGIMLLWYASQQKLWPVWIVASVGIGIAAYNHPIMGEKIKESIAKDDVMLIQTAMDNASDYETIFTPQRFASFRISWMEFLDNPLLGFGGHDADTFGGRKKIIIVIVTGLGEILRRFGLVGMSFFLWATWKSGQYWNGKSSVPNTGVVLFCIVISVAFSYGQILQPIFMIFWASGIFQKKPTEQTLAVSYA